MKRRICSNCGTVQPAAGKFCVSCGEKLDDVSSGSTDSDYIDSRLFFRREKWMNIVVLAAILALAGDAVVMNIFGNTHYVWIPFLSAVVFGVTAFIFAFPEVSYKVLCYSCRATPYRRYSFSWRMPDDIDDPYPSSINQMFIVFGVLSAIAFLGSLWFLANLSSFVIPLKDDIFNMIDFG